MTDVVESRSRAAKRLSGIVLNQNQAPEATDDKFPIANAWRYQEFRLPETYTRGTLDTEQRRPGLTGFQLFVDIAQDCERIATLDWKLQAELPGIGWSTLTSGTTTGVHSDGNEVWLDVFFSQPVEVSFDLLTRRFRLAFKGRDAVDAPKDIPIAYFDAEAYVIIGDERVNNIKLEPDTPYRLDFHGLPSVLYWDSKERTVTYSVQQGVTAAWYAIPNPIGYRGVAAYDSDGVTVLQDTARNIAFLFRILAASADSGVDFLGNQFRSVAVENSPNLVESGDRSITDLYWLSKPNPSKFAVETLYFDVRDDNNDATVIDHILIDPITAGVYFHVYYSDEGEPGTTTYTWESKVWTPVPQSFQMTKRESHALAAPVTAKYLCIEFSHLQAQPYNPGSFQRPISYKKHPKWVLDYFLLQTAAVTDDPFIPRRVTILYDALQLAYDYYTDDLRQRPNDPATLYPQVNSFLSTRDDASDKVDPTTLALIDTELQPWRQQPALRGKLDYLLTQANPQSTNYPVEISQVAYNHSTSVSTLHREAVVFEQSYPVMFFFVPARHLYREVEAEFDYNRAYFVGVREIAFLRDRYTVAHDHDFYLESTGDDTNAERNDFVRKDNSWFVYDSNA